MHNVADIITLPKILKNVYVSILVHINWVGILGLCAEWSKALVLLLLYPCLAPCLFICVAGCHMSMYVTYSRIEVITIFINK